MNTYTDQIERAAKYIEKANIDFDVHQLARIFSGLDFKRYEILALIPRSVCSIVIVQKCMDQNNPHFCVQYKGAGLYFDTWGEVVDYYRKRFHDNKLDGFDNKNTLQKEVRSA